MENLTTTPGLQHLAEKIFFNLSSKVLDECREVHESWKNILDNPLFWFRICKLHQYIPEWKRFVQLKRLANNSKKNKEFN